MTPDMNAALGEQLLPRIVDLAAEQDPDREYACIARDFDMSKGIVKVTMARLANAVNGVAHWIDTSLRLPTPFSTIAYLGVPDIRYTFIVLAAVKCGHKALLLSPRNTFEINAELIDRANGAAIVHSPELGPVARGISGLRPNLQVSQLSSLAECLAVNTTKYPYNKDFSDAWQEPIAVLHSSGSTGKPKLVTVSHATLAASNSDPWIPVPRNRKPQNSALWNFEGGGRYYTCFPPFHLAGLTSVITMPIRYGATVVMGPATLPPSGSLLKNLLDAVPMRAAYLPPTIAEQWMREPGAFDQAKKLDWILFSGGPLATSIGDELCKHTVLSQIFGSLETGQAQLLVPDPPSDWEWLEFNTEDDIELREELNGAHELVLIQTEKSKPRRMLTYNFPEVEEWATGDLFIKHPTKDGLWRFIGRKDDLLVLSSGHKFQPVSMESELLGHELVTGALVVGLGRPQPALLLEVAPAGQSLSEEQLMAAIWPAIDAANDKVQEYGRISRDKVAFIKEPFSRAGKGTVIRGMTTQRFAVAIAGLYADAEGSTEDIELFQRDPHQFIQGQVKRLTRRPQIGDDEDIFSGGFDSLMTAELSRRLVAASTSGRSVVTLRDVYEHPTINALTSFIMKSAAKDSVPNSPAGVQKLVETYSTRISAGLRALHPISSGITVAILGSRGSFGTILLKKLLAMPEISKVICLNRQTTAKPSTKTDKIVDLVVDLSRPKLGLSDTDLREALSSVNLIIHNAWRVDFNLSLASFEPELIKSVVELIDLSGNLPNSPRVAFISSVAATNRWAESKPNAPVPEDVVVDPSVSAKRGYGFAKLTSEILLASAARTTGAPVTVLRPGQIGGPSAPGYGEWSRKEAIFALVQASKTMLMAPNDLPPIDWIPVNDLADIVTDLLIHDLRASTKLSTYNLVNPTQSPWTMFVKSLQKRMPDVQSVSMQDWVKALEKLAMSTTGDASQQIPALKLLDYFRSLAQESAKAPTYETHTAVANSKSMKELGAINESIMDGWLGQWGF